MSTQDIREWARANGWDVADQGRLRSEVRKAYEARDQDPATEDDIFVIEPTSEAAAAEVPPVPPAAAASPKQEERPPRPAPLTERGGLLGRKRTPAAGKAKGPKTPRRRVSIENIVSSCWGLGAMALARKPEALPLARVLDMQAPVVGSIGEDKLKGTMIDRVLQPLARAGENGEIVAGVVGPPVCVSVVMRWPDAYPVVKPIMKMCMMTWLEISEPAMKKIEERQARWSEKFGDYDLDAMCDSFFADIPMSGPESPMEEEHIRKAKGD